MRKLGCILVALCLLCAGTPALAATYSLGDVQYTLPDDWAHSASDRLNSAYTGDLNDSRTAMFTVWTMPQNNVPQDEQQQRDLLHFCAESFGQVLADSFVGDFEDLTIEGRPAVFASSEVTSPYDSSLTTRMDALYMFVESDLYLFMIYGSSESFTQNAQSFRQVIHTISFASDDSTPAPSSGMDLDGLNAE